MSDETVRSYLLGALDDAASVAIEERYFTDREFLLRLQAAETALIEEYLASGLPPLVKSRFEERYLRIPVLQARVQEVRQARSRQFQNEFRSGLRFAIAAAAGVCLVAAGVWISMRPVAPRPLPALVVGSSPGLALSLSPGLTKGGNPGSAALILPIDGPVRLFLELPGRHSLLHFSATLLRLSPDGKWNAIWAAPTPQWSIPGIGAQQAVVQLAPSLLSQGQYLIELSTPNGDVLDTYTFSVIRQ